MRSVAPQPASLWYKTSASKHDKPCSALGRLVQKHEDGDPAQDHEPVPGRREDDVDGLVHQEQEQTQTVEEVALVLGKDLGVDGTLPCRQEEDHEDGVHELHAPPHGPFLGHHEVHAAVRARLPDKATDGDPHEPVAGHSLADRPAEPQAEVVADEAQKHEVQAVHEFLPNATVEEEQPPQVHVDEDCPPGGALLRGELRGDGDG
mmetsp:Transcript_91421/g.284927  ORF Transcript_91421/g.284927 Transcript_91421/m.284927 type:complete len:205 (+) Transcript_91421:72-686(+)